MDILATRCLLPNGSLFVHSPNEHSHMIVGYGACSTLCHVSLSVGPDYLGFPAVPLKIS
jgi:hypothetical protein